MKIDKIRETVQLLPDDAEIAIRANDSKGEFTIAYTAKIIHHNVHGIMLVFEHNPKSIVRFP